MNAIIKREFKKLLKQKKLIFSTFLLPCLLIVLAVRLSASDLFQEKKPQRIAVITESQEIREFLAGRPDHEDIQIYHTDERDAAALDGEKTGVVVELGMEKEKIKLSYNSVRLKDASLLARAENLIEETRLYLEDRGSLEQRPDYHITTEKLDLNTEPEIKRAQLSLITVVFFAAALFLVYISINVFAVDSFAGEKQRKTYESIMLSGLSPYRFVAGKQIFVVTVGIFAFLLQLLCFWVSMSVWQPDIMNKWIRMMTNPAAAVIVLVVLVAVSASVLTGIILLISVHFDSIKEAGMYAVLAALAVSGSAFLSGFLDKEIARFLPVINNNSMLEDAILGKIRIPCLAAGIVLGAGIVILCNGAVAVKLNKKES